jgi:hypothetical protein
MVVGVILEVRRTSDCNGTSRLLSTGNGDEAIAYVGELNDIFVIGVGVDGISNNFLQAGRA